MEEAAANEDEVVAAQAAPNDELEVDSAAGAEEAKNNDGTPMDSQRGRLSSVALEGGHISMNTISVGGSVLDFDPIDRPESSLGQGSQGS